MAGFVNALSASFVLLLIMAVGYIMGHLGWLGTSEKRFLSKYLINIAVPCNCIVGVLNNLDRDDLAKVVTMLICALCTVTGAMLLSMVAATLLRLPRKQWGVFVSMAGLSNVIFIGIPVCTQLFGEACMPHLMVYFLANSMFVQAVALMLIKRAGSNEVTRFSLGKFIKDLLSSPPIVSLFVALALMLLDVSLPSLVMKFAGYISDSLSPLALIYCGFIIFEVGLKNIRLSRGLPTMLVIRLIIAPLICLGFCMVFGVTGLARNVFLVESALPVVTQVTVMAGTYGADDKYAATGACLSTLASFITIPILMLLVGG